MTSTMAPVRRAGHDSSVADGGEGVDALAAAYSALDERYDRALAWAAHGVAALHGVLAALDVLPAAHKTIPRGGALFANAMLAIVAELVPARQTLYVWYARAAGTAPPALLVHRIALGVVSALIMILGARNCIAIFLTALPLALVLIGTIDDESFMMPSVVQESGPLAQRGEVIFDKDDATIRRHDQRKATIRTMVSDFQFADPSAL